MESDDTAVRAANDTAVAVDDVNVDNTAAAVAVAAGASLQIDAYMASVFGMNHP